jgi:queuine tRNA-ribosyltransferase
LLNVNEILGLRLVSIHNSHFFLKVMDDVRMHLRNGTFGEYRRQFIANYVPTEKVRAARVAHEARMQTPPETALG